MTDAEKLTQIHALLNQTKDAFVNILQNAHMFMYAGPEAAAAFKNISFYCMNMEALITDGRQYTEAEAVALGQAEMDRLKNEAKDLANGMLEGAKRGDLN